MHHHAFRLTQFHGQCGLQVKATASSMPGRETPVCGSKINPLSLLMCSSRSICFFRCTHQFVSSIYPVINVLSANLLSSQSLPFVCHRGRPFSKVAEVVWHISSRYYLLDIIQHPEGRRSQRCALLINKQAFPCSNFHLPWTQQVKQSTDSVGLVLETNEDLKKDFPWSNTIVVDALNAPKGLDKYCRSALDESLVLMTSTLRRKRRSMTSWMRAKKLNA